MMSLSDAVAYVVSVGIRFLICNEHGCIFGVAKTEKQASKLLASLSAKKPTMHLRVEEIAKCETL